MKKLVLILGGVIFLAVAVLFLYVGARICLTYYIYSHRNEIEARLYTNVEGARQKAVAQAQAGLEQQAKALQNQSSFFVDPDNYQTEDNWIAASISRELAEMVFAILDPDDSLPDFQIIARVNPEIPSVHVDIGNPNGSDENVGADLTPAFAWDPEGYAPLALKLLGNSPPAASTSNDDSSDILADLQNLTSSTLAKADLRLSVNLRQKPASWQDHEATALALTALALRENAGCYSDTRRLLNRATAQLVLAQALRGNQSPTWPGLIADAAVRTLAGRELDALSHLDVLAARADCPESAKPWIAALRLKAKQDWRVAEPDANSPLLLKLVWFQVLTNDLTGMEAVHRLEKILPPPANDDATPNQPASDWDIPDWGRAVLTCPMGLSVENGHRFAEANITLELKDLDQVLALEGGDPVNEQNMAATFSEKENDTVSKDGTGKLVVQAIGRGTFKAAALRHLYGNIPITYYWMNTELAVPEAAEQFYGKMEALFRNVPKSKLVLSHVIPSSSPDEARQRYEEWQSRNKTWKVWEVVPEEARNLPGSSNLKSFYGEGVPFGTVYDIEYRREYIDPVNTDKVAAQNLADYNKVMETVKTLPIGQQAEAFKKLMTPYLAKEPKAPTGPTPTEQKLLKLNPDCYALVVDHVPVETLISVVQPFLDYKIEPMDQIDRLFRKYIDDATHEAIWRKHVVLDPDAYFGLAGFLRQEGKIDEAAEMTRKGLAEGYDQVLMSNSVWDLVDYDLKHGLKDEAEKVASDAANVGSSGGMGAEMYLLEQEGKLDEAEAIGNELKDRYGEDSDLIFFYAAHKDHFPDKYIEAEKRMFPGGMDRAEFASFYQPPDGGCIITGDSAPVPASGLKLKDVIVALNGYRVRSVNQYDFVRALSLDPLMDFVVWRDGKYTEVKATLPDQRLHANIDTYGSG